MSITPIGHPFDGSGQKTTTSSLREQKLRHEPIACLTAYDYPTARMVDEAGIDMVLVGDSLADHARLREHPLGHDGRDAPSYEGGAARAEAGPAGRRHALCSYQVSAKRPSAMRGVS